MHGLRKRSLGLFKNTNTTMALLQKVGKTFEPAAITLRCVADVEKNSENSRFISSRQKHISSAQSAPDVVSRSGSAVAGGWYGYSKV